MAVSIIIVTYRRPAGLVRTVESLLRQTYGDFEILISDDASGDDTLAICEELRQRDSRVRYRTNSHNLGMPGNLNAAIADCNNELIVNCHDADLYKEDLIAKWVALMEDNPQVGFACTNFHEFDADGKIPEAVEGAQPHLPPVMNGRDFLADRFFCWANWQFGSWVWGTTICRRSIYERMGYFDPAFGFFSDVDMWMRIALEYDIGIVRGVHILLPPRSEAPRMFNQQDSGKIIRRMFWRNRVRYARVAKVAMASQIVMHITHVGLQQSQGAMSTLKRSLGRKWRPSNGS